MDIHKLDEALYTYYSAALATSTHSTYRTAEKRYVNFCKDFALNPFPTTEHILCYYVTCLAQQNLSHATIKTYLSGVRQAQITMGFHEPHTESMPRLQRVIKGIRALQGKAGRTPRQRLPITPAILWQLKKVWEGEGINWNTGMLWAACTVAFFAFCRSGEITIPSEAGYDPSAHLSYGDISVDNCKHPSIIFMRLKRSKTDQFRQGVSISIGATNDDLCPVAALLSFLAIRGPGEGPLFKRRDGVGLTRQKFVEAVRAALRRANLPAEKFAGHSFRIGAATTAAVGGLEDSLIQTLGRWKSSAYLVYIKLDPQQLAAVSKVLSGCAI